MSPTYLRDIRALCAVVDQGSIHGAARELGETASAVSRRLTRLERALGSPLVRRSTRSVRLTDAGEDYHRQARTALELLDNAAAALSSSTEEPSGWLRVMSSPGFALNALPLLIARYSARHPKVRIEVVVSDDPPNFSTHRIDVAFFPSVAALRDSSLIARRIADWTNIFVASPAYLEAAPPIENVADLRSHRIVLGGGIGRSEVAIRAGGVDGAGERIVLTGAIISADINMAAQCCRAGAGVGLMPTMIVAADLACGALVQVLPHVVTQSYAGTFYCLYPSGPVTPAARAFVDMTTGGG